MSEGPSVWFDTRIYLGVAATLLLVIVFYNPYVAVLGAILLYALYLYGKERFRERQKALTAYLESMTHNIDQASYHALQHLPLAIAIVDETGTIHWRNSVLTEWGGKKAEPGESVLVLWPDMALARFWGKMGVQVMKSGDKYYQVIYRPLEKDRTQTDPLAILYVTDISGSETVRAKFQGAMPVLAYIQFDNYSDVLKGLSESQRTAILSEVNQRLAEWVGSFEGLLKKYAEDMYIVLLSRQALDKLLADKFEILDKMRSIHGGNKIPVTLSLGVAADESSFASLSQRAQAGLDLALGRGGDQAAVYTEGKAQFYGGKAKAVEKNTRVKARIVAQAIREIIGDADQVMVMGHANEDFDSLGAAIGVSAMARYVGKVSRVVVSHPGMAVGKMSELLAEYEACKDLFISQAEAVALITPRTLLFVVDTHRPELVAASELLQKAEKVVVIDHHRRAEQFIANPLLVYLEPSTSSTSEMVTELLIYFAEDIELARLEASALYAGIVVDTKNFAVQTGVRTFEAASYLRRAGADPRLVRQLFRVDFDSLKNRAEIIANSELVPGGIIIATCPGDAKNPQIVAAQAADMLLNIDGVRVSFVLFPTEDGVGVSARSHGDINVQLIMEQLGGGGHQTVAGVQVKNVNLVGMKAKVLEIAKSYIEESGQNESNSTTRSEKTR